MHVILKPCKPPRNKTNTCRESANKHCTAWRNEESTDNDSSSSSLRNPLHGNNHNNIPSGKF